MINIEKATGETPKALKAQPKLEDSFADVVSCFYLLFRGEGIPISEIRQYCDLWGVYDEQRFVILTKTAEGVMLSGKN